MIYVIQFITGEYEDKSIHPIAASLSEDTAAGYCNEINDALLAAGMSMDHGHPRGGDFSFKEEIFRVDYNGAKARYIGVPIL